MNDDRKIIHFPNRLESEEEQIHQCDSCASVKLHEVSHLMFEDGILKLEELFDEFFYKILDSLDNDEAGEYAKTLTELINKAYSLGIRNATLRDVREKAYILLSICNDVEDEDLQ